MIEHFSLALMVQTL